MMMKQTAKKMLALILGAAITITGISASFTGGAVRAEDSAETTESFSLDTSVLVGNGLKDILGQETNIGITGSDIAGYQQTYTYMHTDASYADYIDFDGHAFDSLTAKGVKLRYIFDGGARVIQIETWGTMRELLQAGSKITFKKGLPVYYQDSSGNTHKAVLDATYEYECLTTENPEHTQVFQGKRIDTSTGDKDDKDDGKGDTPDPTPTYLNYGLLNECGSFVDGDHITKFNLGIAEGVLADQDVLVELLGSSETSSYVKVAGYTAEQLLEKGVAIRFYPKAAVIQIDPGSQMTLGDFTQITFTKGMTISYNDGASKKAVLSADYKYQITDNKDGTYKMERIGVEIPVTEYHYHLSGPASTFEEGGSLRLNLPLAGGAVTAAGYVSANMITGETAAQNVTVPGYTAKQLVEGGFQMLYIPTAGVVQVVLGSVELKEGMTVTFKKGLSAIYADGTEKKCAILKKDISYQVTKENDVFVMNVIQDFDITITVDGVQKVSGSYHAGTKLNLKKYQNKKKGKIMTVSINGISSQETAYVVSEDADIVIRNRSDICVIVFQDGKTTVSVQEYKLNAKKISLPYAPDRDGYDDSWETFRLKNDVITVKAVHTKKQTEPVIRLSGVQTDQEESAEPDQESDVTSPKTGEQTGRALILLLGAGMVLAWSVSRMADQSKIR